jgi:DNA-binding transcriptional MerR regulator
MDNMTQFNMKAVLRLTGLTADTLRAWERRYQAVTPLRSENGRRVYKIDEIERLKLLSKLVKSGRSISSIANLTDAQLIAQSVDSTPVLSNEILVLLEALKKFDLNRLQGHLSRILYEMSSRDVVYYLIPQMMTQVGLGVEKGNLSISQEHAISEIFGNILRKIYDGLLPIQSAREKEQTLLFATPEGDYHEFGLLMVAILCRNHGYQTQYLGPNLPAQSLIEACKQVKPDIVILSVSCLPKEQEKISPRNYLKEIDTQISKSCDLWVGGTGSSQIKRSLLRKNLWIFENIKDLEKKLKENRNFKV